MVNSVDIRNSLSAIPRDQLSELEVDILVLSEFAFEVALGGWTQYFDSYCGDNTNRLLEAAKHHSFNELVAWINAIAIESASMVSTDRDTRSAAAGAVSEAFHQRYSDEGIRLAGKAIDLWEELVQKNIAALESNYNARHRNA